MANLGNAEVTHEPLLKYDDDDSCAFGGRSDAADDTDSLEGHVITVIRPSSGKSFYSLLQKPIFLLGSLVVILLLVIVVLGTLLSKSNHKTEKSSQNVCLTAGCLDSAHYMLHAMDKNVDPCKDFFQYACGGWKNANPIPSSESFWGTFTWLWKNNQVVIRRLLMADTTKNSTSVAVQAARTFYDSCMNLDQINNRGARPLHEVIKGLGGWSVSKNSTGKPWDVKTFTFKKTLKTVQLKFRTAAFFDYFVDADDKNSSRNIIKIDQAGLGIARNHYLTNETLSKQLTAYLRYMTRVGVLLGGKQKTVENEMREVLKFEKNIAQIFVPPDNRSQIDQMYNKMTIKQLSKLCPKIPWLDFFQETFKGIASISESDKVVVFATNYLQALSDVIEQANNTVLNNYMVWQVVSRYATSLSTPFRDAHQDLRKVLVGASRAEELWTRCISETDTTVGMALGKLFVKETFQGSSRQQATEMIDAIRDAFKKRLPLLDWMDEKTRRAAIDKADAVRDMIGYPLYILNDKQLDDKYKGLTDKFSPTKYFENQITHSEYSSKKNLNQLEKAVNKQKWLMTPQTVNAYYSPSRNQIVFPAGILQAPYYDKRFPKYANYGSIGGAVGHELVHAFDNSGRMYDKKGNYGVPWWTQKSVDGFKAKTDCLIDQYSKFSYFGKNVKGKFTLGENIADNGGLKAAYTAYQDWVKKNGQEKTLPVLGKTNDQLFFIAYGQSWCASIRPEKAISMLEWDPHSPNKFRVLGTLSNLKEFSQAFKCPVGSPMNPANKCVIW